MTRYHNPEAETLSRDELTALQDRRLREVVRRVAERNAGYRARALKLLPHVCASCGREFDGRRLKE